MSEINWDEIREKLPYERNPEQYAKRTELFNLMDPNGNGYLSLAEVDAGLRDVLQIDELFDCKPCIIRAFSAAKAIAGKRSSVSDDYVTRSEFRLLLQYLRMYFEYYVMFDAVDTGDDRRVDLEEFKNAVPKMAEWGVEIADPEAEFAEVDTNGGGQILFHEFADWAIKKSLDLEDDDD
eukprot:GCRY01000198.1.p1 GENE.GCRY01000198.1~~GCRY01000198.1.p1  ORF type:complete len:204 (+),score=44.82 GCRY01000198.1:77-613(+)